MNEVEAEEGEIMSINVTWPTETSISESAARDCLENYLSSDGIKVFLSMPDYDRRRIFEIIKESGRYVPNVLLNR